MINIIIPMAGRGSRFAQKGYNLPKPLIPIHDVPMIRVVIENIRPKDPHRFIFLVLEDHLKEYQLNKKLMEWSTANSVIVPVRAVTEGAACTVLLAEDSINNDEPLMIANSDQWVDFNVDNYLANMNEHELDGQILTMKANDPKWSYVRFSAENNTMVTEVVEKVVVSDEATVGIYNFKKGRDFVNGAKKMIQMNKRVNNEFYVAPVYNELINDKYKIGIYNIGSEGNGMYGIGTPEDYITFINHQKSLLSIKGISNGN